MATIAMKSMDGADKGVAEFDEALLERERGAQAVKDSVVAFLANIRSAHAHTKNRALVAGGGAKPWRQKGNGRARSGSNSSPVWVGGGTVFGPQNANYKQKMNQKVEKLALKRAFTDRVDEGDVLVLDELNLETPKTKGLVNVLKTIGAGDDVLIVVDQYTDNLLLASGNLPKTTVFKAAFVNAFWMMRYKKVVITSAGLDVLRARLA